MQHRLQDMLAVAAVLLLGGQLVASQTSCAIAGMGARGDYTTNLTLADSYPPFPVYGGSATGPACSATLNSGKFPIAVQRITAFQGSGLYGFFGFPDLDNQTTVQFLYSSDPRSSTTTGCIAEGAILRGAQCSFTANLTAMTTYYLVILSGPDPSSTGANNIVFIPPTTTMLPTSSTVPPASTALPTTPPATTAAATTRPTSSTPAATIAAPTSPPIGTTAAQVSTAVPLTTLAQPSSTPAVATSPPVAATTAPPSTANGTVTLTANFTPDPPQAGQPLTVSGLASSSSGPPPTGNVTVLVDGAPAGTTSVTPTSGRRLLQGGVSTYTITIIAPSTTGPHTISVVFFPSTGGSTGVPVAIPLAVTVNVAPATVATVTVAVSPSTLRFPLCKSPIEVVASVTGSSGATPPSGSVTLSINGVNSLNATLASAPISGGAATFSLRSLDPVAAAVQALTKTPGGAELLPGSYQLTADYSGDTLYPPASGSATLEVALTCPLITLKL